MRLQEITDLVTCNHKLPHESSNEVRAVFNLRGSSNLVELCCCSFGSGHAHLTDEGGSSLHRALLDFKNLLGLDIV